jgi:hypothetical protein
LDEREKVLSRQYWHWTTNFSSSRKLVKRPDTGRRTSCQKEDLEYIPGVTTANRIPSGVAALKKIVDTCLQLATNSEFVHERILQIKASNPERQLHYHRFNVDRDMEHIELQDWKKMEEIGVHTAAYMEGAEMVAKKNSCVFDLITIKGEWPRVLL